MMTETTNPYAEAIARGDWATLWVCVDCYFTEANGEVPEDRDTRSPEPLSLISDEMDISSGLLAEEHSDGCPMRDYPNTPSDHECDCENGGFSWSPCQGCGTYLGGDRYALTAVWLSGIAS